MKKYSIVFYFLLTIPISYSQITVIDSIFSGGIYRNYRLYVPAAYSGSTARPLLLNLHGYTSDAFAQQYYSNFMPIADTANFLMVCPNGTKLNGQQFWNAGFGLQVNDVQFLSNLIDTISVQYNIDANCVYSTGMSNGGFMSYTLACELNNKIAAIASVTGTMSSVQYNNCSPSRAVPVMEIHGTADGSVPYNGAAGAMHIDTVVRYWVLNNGCSTQSIFSNIPNTNTTDGCTAEHYVYGGGINNSSVELYKIINGGHTWPGAPYIIGPTCMDFNASEKIWQFFAKYKLNQFVGVDEVKNKIEFIFYPNPVKDKIVVKNSFDKLQIFDLTGKLLKITTEKEIDVSGFLAGMYFIRVEKDNIISTQKFIKQ